MNDENEPFSDLLGTTSSKYLSKWLPSAMFRSNGSVIFISMPTEVSADKEDALRILHRAIVYNTLQEKGLLMRLPQCCYPSSEEEGERKTHNEALPPGPRPEVEQVWI